MRNVIVNTKINVSCIGDPMQPRTWSGTPYNICSELINKKQLGSVVDSSINNRIIKGILLSLTKIIYGSDDYARSIFCRKIVSNRVCKKFLSNDKLNILHMGTLDMPINIKDKNRHYLYCDSTWNLWVNSISNSESYSEKMINMSEKLEKKCYEMCEHIFPISEYVKENLVTHYGINESKITVVGTGTGGIKAYYGEKDYSEKTLLFVAKNRFKDKGGELLVEAFKYVYELDKSIKLIIVGDEKYNNLFDNVLNVKVFGYVSWEQLQDLFNKSSVFIMPAVNEPWGLVYLEALKCKMPIIGLNKNSLPEITNNKKYGFLADKVDAKILAKEIIKAFSDLDRLKSMGLDGQNYCLEKYSWENTVDKIIKRINEVN